MSTNFPNSVDVFEELFDLPENKIADANTLQGLRQLKAAGSAYDTVAYNNLMTELANYILTPERWNLFGNALVAMEEYLLELEALGEYSSGTTYKPLNMVLYNGDGYVCIEETTGSFNATKWKKISEQGETGPMGPPGAGNVKRETFTSTASQTVFNLTQGTYVTASNHTFVYIEGVRQTLANYVETNGSTITMSESLPAGLEVVIEYYAA